MVAPTQVRLPGQRRSGRRKRRRRRRCRSPNAATHELPQRRIGAAAFTRLLGKAPGHYDARPWPPRLVASFTASDRPAACEPGLRPLRSAQQPKRRPQRPHLQRRLRRPPALARATPVPRPDTSAPGQAAALERCLRPSRCGAHDLRSRGIEVIAFRNGGAFFRGDLIEH